MIHDRTVQTCIFDKHWTTNAYHSSNTAGRRRMTSAEFRREKLAPREEHECTAMKDEIQELKDQNKKTKAELLAQMELEKQELNDQVHELKNLLRQLVDK